MKLRATVRPGGMYVYIYTHTYTYLIDISSFFSSSRQLVPKSSPVFLTACLEFPKFLFHVAGDHEMTRCNFEENAGARQAARKSSMCAFANVEDR